MQNVRHLLIDNCWLGWWCGKSYLQCLELCRRQIKHVGSHSRVVSFNTICIVRIFVFRDTLQCKSCGFGVHVYSRFTYRGSVGHGTRYKYWVKSLWKILKKKL